MTKQLRRELRKFLKQYKASPISEQYQEAADRVNDLIPALVDTIKDEELDTIMIAFTDYLMTSIISPPRELDVQEDYIVEQKLNQADAATNHKETE